MVDIKRWTEPSFAMIHSERSFDIFHFTYNKFSLRTQFFIYIISQSQTKHTVLLFRLQKNTSHELKFGKGGIPGRLHEHTR